MRDPFAYAASFTAETTQYVALALRVRGEFSSKINLREMLPHSVVVASETSNRIVRAKCVINPVMTGTTNWAYVDQTRSCMEYCTPTAMQISNGRFVASTAVSTGGAGEIELHELDLRLEPGDVIAITLQTVSQTSVCDVAINWQEK